MTSLPKFCRTQIRVVARTCIANNCLRCGRATPHPRAPRKPTAASGHARGKNEAKFANRTSPRTESRSTYNIILYIYIYLCLCSNYRVSYFARGSALRRIPFFFLFFFLVCVRYTACSQTSGEFEKTPRARTRVPLSRSLLSFSRPSALGSSACERAGEMIHRTRLRHVYTCPGATVSN